jgi:HrpA-like RNA helicase
VQVVVIEGETGCGKSTQVPQFVLEDAAARGKPCSIIVTQPRRISALGVSERVAAERGEAVGGVVGYSIRLESKSSAQTALLFCTTGILTRRLEDDRDLEGEAHDLAPISRRPRADLAPTSRRSRADLAPTSRQS